MTPISIPDLEQTYDTLALAIDQAGAAKSELFLVKLALLLANELNDARRFGALCDSALQDL